MSVNKGFLLHGESQRLSIFIWTFKSPYERLKRTGFKNLTGDLNIGVEAKLKLYPDKGEDYGLLSVTIELSTEPIQIITQQQVSTTLLNWGVSNSTSTKSTHESSSFKGVLYFSMKPTSGKDGIERAGFFPGHTANVSGTINGTKYYIKQRKVH